MPEPKISKRVDTIRGLRIALMPYINIKDAAKSIKKVSSEKSFA